MSLIGSVLTNTIFGKVFDLGSKTIDGYFEKKKAEIAAMNTQDTKAAELALGAVQADVEMRRAEIELLKLEQGSIVTRMIRPLFAAPFIIFLFKIIVWDKVLGLGRTDPLDPNVWAVFMIVVGAYFGGRTVERTAGIIGAVFRNRK